MKNKINEWFFFNDERKDHLRSLDGLRGIAVILVLLSHSSNNNFYFHEALAFNGIGKGGVYLFYVLSAFLLDRQIASALMQQSADSFFLETLFSPEIFKDLSTVHHLTFSFLDVVTDGYHYHNRECD